LLGSMAGRADPRDDPHQLFCGATREGTNMPEEVTITTQC
jgi:hypothetical protein